jgi:hypothetical protein
MSTTAGPCVPGRTVNVVFLPVAASRSSSFLSDMIRDALRGAILLATVNLHEPYTVARGNQGNGRAILRAAWYRYSTILNS